MLSKIRRGVAILFGLVENTIHRPWGYYIELAGGDKAGFKVKKITVLPNSALSLQYHHHREEHWVVLKGIATVHLDENVYTLLQGQSIFIPKLGKHRLGNQTNEPIEIIEVQTGPYLGEDDIIRLQDNYGRANPT